MLLFLTSCSCVYATAKDREATPQVSWHCELDAEQGRAGPASIVVNGHPFVLLKQGTSGCHTLERSEYRAHDVPDYAISAAVGWFAGGGEEFYALLRRDKLFVYHRLVEETGPLHPRYRLIARIPTNLTPR